jgi:hypothetical protein
VLLALTRHLPLPHPIRLVFELQAILIVAGAAANLLTRRAGSDGAQLRRILAARPEYVDPNEATSVAPPGY